MDRADHLAPGVVVAAVPAVVLVPVVLVPVVHWDLCVVVHRVVAHWAFLEAADRWDPAAGHWAVPAVDRRDRVVVHPVPGRSHQEVVHRDPAVAPEEGPKGGQGPGQAENFAECDRHAGHRR